MKTLRQTLMLLSASGIFAAAAITTVTMLGGQEADRNARSAFVAKDVGADVLPPPLYLVEMRLVLSQGVEGSIDAPTAQKEVERLEKEYLARVDYWTQNPPYGLEKQLLGAQHEDGKRFIEKSKSVLETLGGATAEPKLALRDAHESYLKHRAGNHSVPGPSNHWYRGQ